MSSYGKFNSPAQAEAHSDSGVPSADASASSALPPEHHEHRRKKSTAGVVEQKSLWNAEIIRQALLDHPLDRDRVHRHADCSLLFGRHVVW